MSTLCRGKVAFETEDAARWQMDHLKQLERTKNARRARRLSVYCCPICRQYHVGHKRTGVPPASKNHRA